jgi:hypothetical protein
MQLSVQDRLILLHLTRSVEGNLSTLRVVRDLQQELGFSDDESLVLQFVQGPEQLTWAADVDVQKDVTLAPTAKSAVLSAFKRLEDQGKLTMDFLLLYEKLLEA